MERTLSCRCDPRARALEIKQHRKAFMAAGTP